MAATKLLFTNTKTLPKFIPTCYFHKSSNLYAVKQFKKGAAAGGTKVGQQIKKIVLDVETDPEKLVTRCCGANIYVEGSDPELKPDSEYPDWLWTLWTNPKPIPLDELDPNSQVYWNRLKKIAIKKKNQSLKLKKF